MSNSNKKQTFFTDIPKIPQFQEERLVHMLTRWHRWQLMYSSMQTPSFIRILLQITLPCSLQ